MKFILTNDLNQDLNEPRCPKLKKKWV